MPFDVVAAPLAETYRAVNSDAGPQVPTVSPGRWVPVCPVDHVIVSSGVAALISGRQVAVFRTGDGDVYATSNFDPTSRAFVISRSLVGDKTGTVKITSPIYKQSFNLKTGESLDDPSVRLPVYPARIREGIIEVWSD